MSAEGKDFDQARFEAATQGVDLPPEGSIADLAIHGHTMFCGHVEAGFSESQAVYIVAAMLTGNPGYPPK